MAIQSWTCGVQRIHSTSAGKAVVVTVDACPDPPKNRVRFQIARTHEWPMSRLKHLLKGQVCGVGTQLSQRYQKWKVKQHASFRFKVQ